MCPPWTNALRMRAISQMRTTQEERDQIALYFESQTSGDESVVHVDRLLVERVGGQVHEVWDVHTSTDGRWWVVTEPMNLYTQDDFKSANVVLSFHIGLTARVMSRHTVPVAADPAALLPESWRRWEHAGETMTTAAEAEDFQAVGMQLRECLVGFASEVASDDLVPAGEDRPQAANVSKWSELLANFLAAGSSSERLRSYLKKLGSETWAYVNWLTHARNARHLDAEIGIAAVSHMLSTFTAARLRWQSQTHATRCDNCSSYKLVRGVCSKCGWHSDEDYTEGCVNYADNQGLEEPCVPSSDVSTFITPDDYS